MKWAISSLLPIQETVIPMIQDGKSLFVLAKTGSGKTASYLIPAIETRFKRMTILHLF